MNARLESRDIYLAASNRTYDPSRTDSETNDTACIEHILRAVLEVLTPEQRAKILEKVK